MKKIAMYDLEGFLLEVFEMDTYLDIEKEVGLSQGMLTSCLNNRQHQSNNRQFREYKSNRRPLIKIGDVSNLVNGSTEYKPLLKKYKGKVICVYNSLSEAVIKTGVNGTSISLVCDKENKTNKTAGGFEWEYLT